MTISYYPLPEPDPAWQMLITPMLAPAPPLSQFAIDSTCIAKELKIVSPPDLQRTTCPVNKDNVDSFTASERIKAAEAQEVENFAALEDAVSRL